MKKIIILFLVVFIVTGCYDCQELNNMNIVTGIGFDKEDNEYVVSFEITKVSDSENSGQKEASIISGKDKNLATAIEKAINNSNKEAYFKHVNAILISEDIAKDGISNIMDYLLRDGNISTTFFTVICDNASELLSTKIEEDTVSDRIVSLITSHINAEILNNVDIITSNIINNRKDIALPYVEITDEDKLLIDNKAYFKGDKMIDKISNKIYNFLILGNRNIVFNNDNNVLNIYDKKVTYDVDRDKIIVKITGDGRIVSLNQDTSLNNYSDYESLEKEINKIIGIEVNRFLNKTLSNNSDLLGFKDMYYKKYKKKINKIDYEIYTDITLVKNGTILEVIHD